jgi:hypothetical protein
MKNGFKNANEAVRYLQGKKITVDTQRKTINLRESKITGLKQCSAMDFLQNKFGYMVI